MKTKEEILAQAKMLKQKDVEIFSGMDAIIAEDRRVAAVAHNAPERLKKIQDEFDRQTGLDKTDYAFLGLATALQVARWAIIAHFSELGQGFDPDDRMKHDDKRITDLERKRRDEYKNKHYQKGDEVVQGEYKDWLQILYCKPPFDTCKGTEQFGLDMGGTAHRLKTLGHDPVLGWVFGTMNIMTDLMTTNDFQSYEVRNGALVGRASTIRVFWGAYESAGEDPKRLAAAVVAEAIHLESDEHTKLGLPVPILSSVCEPLVKELTKHHYDKLCFTRDLKAVALQVGFSMLINLIIGLVHGLFYDPKVYGNRDVFAVKTRKILRVANVISSASNLLYTGISVYATGPKSWKNLDIGGLAVSLYRLVSDTKFVYRIQEEYVEREFSKLIQGCSNE